ncbi:MAG: hypothetical protein ACLPSF_15310 [Methylocella sp.]
MPGQEMRSRRRVRELLDDRVAEVIDELVFEQIIVVVCADIYGDVPLRPVHEQVEMLVAPRLMTPLGHHQNAIRNDLCFYKSICNGQNVDSFLGEKRGRFHSEISK